MAMIAVYVVSALAGAALLGTAVYHKNTILNLHKIGPNTVRAGLHIEKEKIEHDNFLRAYKYSSTASTGSSRSHSINSPMTGSSRSHSINSPMTGSSRSPMKWGGKNTRRRHKRRYKK